MSRTDKFLTLGASLMGVLLLLSLLACGGGSDGTTDPGTPTSSMDACGGIQGLTCQQAGEVCIYDQAQNCGRYDQQGSCQLPPEACTQQYEPVCGCDGQTYSNACEAHAAGVSVESQGECPQTGGQDCGGWLGDTCASDEVCVYDSAAQCGRGDASGTCQPKPQVCPQIYDPVCGCDGHTYPNSCHALAAGVSVDHQGSCQAPGSCASNSDCASDEYCSFTQAAQCGQTDSGTCTARTDVCPQLYDPVCGCDGHTYSNQCTAASFGVSVAQTGECSSVQ